MISCRSKSRSNARRSAPWIEPLACSFSASARPARILFGKASWCSRRSRLQGLDLRIRRSRERLISCATNRPLLFSGHLGFGPTSRDDRPRTPALRNELRPAPDPLRTYSGCSPLNGRSLHGVFHDQQSGTVRCRGRHPPLHQRILADCDRLGYQLRAKGAEFRADRDQRLQCEAAGGKLQAAGLSGFTYGGFGTHSFSDAGKPCRDGKQCLSRFCNSRRGQRGGARAVGVCASDEYPYGCIGWVRRGVVVIGPCVD